MNWDEGGDSEMLSLRHHDASENAGIFRCFAIR